MIKEKTNRIKHYSCRLFITAAFSVIELVSALSTHTIFFLFLNRDYYFTAVSWVRSDAIAVIWMNRAQNISLVTECNQPTWICKKVSFVYHLSQFVFLLVFFDHIAYTSHKREPNYERLFKIFLRVGHTTTKSPTKTMIKVDKKISNFQIRKYVFIKKQVFKKIIHIIKLIFNTENYFKNQDFVF